MTYDENYEWTKEEIKKIEAEARMHIEYMEAHKRRCNPDLTAKPNPNPVAELVDDLRHALNYNSHMPEELVLKSQARALDRAFRRLLMDGDEHYDETDHCAFIPIRYAAAFKAQEQYRRTVKQIHTMDQDKKKQAHADFHDDITKYLPKS